MIMMTTMPTTNSSAPVFLLPAPRPTQALWRRCPALQSLTSSRCAWRRTMRRVSSIRPQRVRAYSSSSLWEFSSALLSLATHYPRPGTTMALDVCLLNPHPHNRRCEPLCAELVDPTSFVNKAIRANFCLKHKLDNLCLGARVTHKIHGPGTVIQILEARCCSPPHLPPPTPHIASINRMRAPSSATTSEKIIGTSPTR